MSGTERHGLPNPMKTGAEPTLEIIGGNFQSRWEAGRFIPNGRLDERFAHLI